MEHVTVQTYDGFRAAESPRCFFIAGRKVEIIQIEKSSLTPGCRYFQVRGNDDLIYLLEYLEKSDQWNLLTVNRP
jgi:hypothetical protein